MSTSWYSNYGNKVNLVFRIMILRTAATRSEFATGPPCFFVLFDVRIDRRFCDSQDKEVCIYICYINGGPGDI